MDPNALTVGEEKFNIVSFNRNIEKPKYSSAYLGIKQGFENLSLPSLPIGHFHNTFFPFTSSVYPLTHWPIVLQYQVHVRTIHQNIEPVLAYC